jgi:glutamyl-Q tRNA(Asp) synthetase
MNHSSTATRMVGRFAPSPTGPLHFGSLLAALASFLDARHAGGSWHVRIEDIDAPRCDAAHTDTILATLHAFGFRWDGAVLMQSQRIGIYETALQRLAAVARVYACACSRREIADSATRGIEGPVYNGTCRHLNLAWAGQALRVTVCAESCKPIEFTDATQGAQRQVLAKDIGDFVIRRKDGLFAYQLAVVVDDAMQGITHVVRGADLLDSTARQIFLQRALGYATPSYRHIPVATNVDGQKWSKQTLAPALSTQAACTELNRALAFLGQSTWPLNTPAAILERAITAWNPHAIPRVRAQVA